MYHFVQKNALGARRVGVLPGSVIPPFWTNTINFPRLASDMLSHILKISINLTLQVWMARAPEHWGSPVTPQTERQQADWELLWGWALQRTQLWGSDSLPGRAWGHQLDKRQKATPSSSAAADRGQSRLLNTSTNPTSRWEAHKTILKLSSKIPKSSDQLMQKPELTNLILERPLPSRPTTMPADRLPDRLQNPTGRDFWPFSDLSLLSWHPDLPVPYTHVGKGPRTFPLSALTNNLHIHLLKKRNSHQIMVLSVKLSFSIRILKLTISLTVFLWKGSLSSN